MNLKLIIIILLTLAFFVPYHGKSQEIDIIDLSDYQTIIGRTNGKLKVVNFWATWCAPCIRELPTFVQISREYNTQVQLIFISLDDEGMKERASRALAKKGFNGDSYLLNMKDSELSRLYKNWTGAVPLTLVFDSENELITSLEKEIEYETLKELITLKSK